MGYPPLRAKREKKRYIINIAPRYISLCAPDVLDMVSYWRGRRGKVSRHAAKCGQWGYIIIILNLLPHPLFLLLHRRLLCVYQVAFATGEGPGGASCARFDTRKDGTYIAIPDAAALKDLKEWTFSTW